jgi:pyruvate-formate lyase
VQHNLLGVMDDEKIRLREEVQEQIRALNELKEMAATYGDDISKPATNSREAVQVRNACLLQVCTCLTCAETLAARLWCSC